MALAIPPTPERSEVETSGFAPAKGLVNPPLGSRRPPDSDGVVSLDTSDGGITVSVNGQDVDLPAGSTLADLIEQLRLDRTRIAVEHNLRVVPRLEHVSLRLNHGDRLEIVTFVGGG